MEFLREWTEQGDREARVKLSWKAEKWRSGWKESQGQQGTLRQALSQAHLMLTGMIHGAAFSTVPLESLLN